MLAEKTLDEESTKIGSLMYIKLYGNLNVRKSVVRIINKHK